MATIKSFTDISQSRKLAEILPLETADMRFCFSHELGGRVIGHYPMIGNEPSLGTIPCWSLAALRNLLPVAIKVNENTYLFESHNTFDKCWVYRYYNEDDISYLYCKDTNEVDACVAMVEKLHGLKML